MEIKDVMTPRIEVIHTEDTLADASAKMKTIDRDILPVFDGDRCVGVVTEQSVLQKAETQGLGASSTKVTEAMSPSVITLPEDMEIEEAVQAVDRQPEHERLRYILVIGDEDRPAGMVAVEALRRQLRGDEPDAGTFAVEGVESISSIADYKDDAVEYMSDESFPASDPPPPPTGLSRDPEER